MTAMEIVEWVLVEQVVGLHQPKRLPCTRWPSDQHYRLGALQKNVDELFGRG